MHRFLSILRSISLKFVDSHMRFNHLLDRLEKYSTCTQDEFLTINEAATLCKVTARTLRRWKKSGLIKPVMIGRTIHYSKNGLWEAAIANRLNKK